MKERHYKNKKHFHIIPFVLGLYGGYLGLGLTAIGISEIREGIGIVRLLVGVGMAGFGLFGIWDGVRDLVKPEKKPEKPAVRQMILTDLSGARSSNVTMECLRRQLSDIAESSAGAGFHIQMLPPILLHSQEQLKQISCLYQSSQENPVTLTAFCGKLDGSCQIRQKNMTPLQAEEWLGQFLADTLDFTGWETAEAVAREERGTDEANPYWHEFLVNQNGLMTYWRKLLIIYGESWHDEHRFFSVRDVELAIEGIHEGRYQKVVLEWGVQIFNLFPGTEQGLTVIWCNSDAGSGASRFLARQGTVVQVKFWLTGYLNRGFFEEMSGWTDITASIEKERKKGVKKHGKLF